MPNMLDYLDWRGDLTLQQAELNENDELILSQLAYVAFGEHLPGLDAPGDLVSVRDAVGWVLDNDPDGERIHQTGFMWKDNKTLMAALRESRRFGDMQLSCYMDIVSPEDEKQFAALTIGLGDGTMAVVYRGTDDTLIGWKEDLNMAIDGPIPAQQEAVRYLERVARAVPGPLRLMGHSKGGNLALYAGAHCSDAVEARLLSVTSHDGPGQTKDTICSDGYARIRDRLRVYIPHFSLVGMLLEHENNYTIVQSTAKTVLQHDAFSWQMKGTRMMYADAPSESSLNTNRVLRQWIDTLDTEEKRLFIEAVYEVMCETYGDTLPEDVETNWSASAQAVFANILKLSPKVRSRFTKGLGELFSTALRNIRFPWQKEDEQEKREAMEEVMDTVRLE